MSDATTIHAEANILETESSEHQPNGIKGVLGLITARGGSKGLPRKNVLTVGGKPLIGWTIEAALKSKSIERVVLSSDDDEIMGVGKTWGCEVPFQRPARLANDTASSMDVVLHALGHLQGYEYLILLQPTSPLRTAADIDAAFDLLQSTGAPSCVSVCEVDQSPYWMFRIKDGSKVERMLPEEDSATRRQDLPPIYVLNGAIYVARVEWLRQSKSFLGEGCVAYVMPKERSLDIDNAEDFEVFRRTVEEA